MKKNAALTLLTLLGALYRPAFEGDDQQQDDQQQDDQQQDDQQQDDQQQDDTGKKFSQADVNRMLANNKKSLQATVTNLQSQLTTMKQSNTATQEDKDTLQGTINDLESQMLSKDEISKRDKKRADKERTEAVSKVEGERDQWRSRFEETLAVNALTQAAVKHKAFDPAQIVNMHQGDITVTEIKEDGVGTGKFESRMKIQSTNEKNETVELNLSVGEAVKELATRSSYANLFNFDGKHGMQRHNNSSIQTNLDRKQAASGGMEAYKKNREAIMAN